ncbi:hypothetical protein [Vibrio harveyi]
MKIKTLPLLTLAITSSLVSGIATASSEFFGEWEYDINNDNEPVISVEIGDNSLNIHPSSKNEFKNVAQIGFKNDGNPVSGYFIISYQKPEERCETELYELISLEDTIWEVNGRRVKMNSFCIDYGMKYIEPTSSKGTSYMLDALIPHKGKDGSTTINGYKFSTNGGYEAMLHLLTNEVDEAI